MYFEIFYYFIGGLGLLLAGIGGFKAFSDWISQNKKKRAVEKHIKELRLKYPIEFLDKNFQLIMGDIDRRAIWLHDFTTKKRHWILSPETMKAMYLDYTRVKVIPQAELNALEQGEDISI